MYGISVRSEPLVRTDPFVSSCRIMHLESEVKTQEQESEVKSESSTPVCGYAFTESPPSEACELVFRCVCTL